MNANNETSQYKQRRTKTSVNLMFWSMGWVVSMAITAFGPRFIWDFNTTLSVVFVVINLAVGAGMLLSNRRHLNSLDELERKIMMDAMATTLGVGLVVSLSYELLEDIKLISYEPEIPHVVFVMCFTYMVSIIAGRRKFK